MTTSRDLREGYVSPERCLERYGVAVREGSMVDTAATEARRRKIASRRLRLAVTTTEDSP